MAIIVLRAWYVDKYEPIKTLIQRPHDLRLSRNSLLKSGLRADFLDDRQQIETAAWFERYLQGEAIEFYLEGSGSYTIANIDLVSQEIYFSKRETMAGLDPTIFVSTQTIDPTASQTLVAAIEQQIDQINQTARIPLSLNISSRPQDAPVRLGKMSLRQIRKCLLFVADVTPIATVASQGRNKLLLSSEVCVELGYALETKQEQQILLVQYSNNFSGELLFDLPPSCAPIPYHNVSELNRLLPSAIATRLQQFKIKFD